MDNWLIKNDDVEFVDDWDISGSHSQAWQSGYVTIGNLKDGSVTPSRNLFNFLTNIKIPVHKATWTPNEITIPTLAPNVVTNIRIAEANATPSWIITAPIHILRPSNNGLPNRFKSAAATWYTINNGTPIICITCIKMANKK